MQKRAVEVSEFETHLGRLAFCREPFDSFLEGPSAVRNQGRQAEISLLSSEHGNLDSLSARKIPCSTAQGILLESPKIVGLFETVCPKMAENGEISLFFSLLPGNSSHSRRLGRLPRELRPFARLARIEAFSVRLQDAEPANASLVLGTRGPNDLAERAKNSMGPDACCEAGPWFAFAKPSGMLQMIIGDFRRLAFAPSSPHD